MNLDFWNYLYFLGLSLKCWQNVQEIGCFVFSGVPIAKLMLLNVLFWFGLRQTSHADSLVLHSEGVSREKKMKTKNSRLFCKEKCHGKTSSNHQYPSMICSFEIELQLCYVDWMVCQSHKSVKWWFCNNLYYIFNFWKKKSKANFFSANFFMCQQLSTGYFQRMLTINISH